MAENSVPKLSRAEPLASSSPPSQSIRVFISYAHNDAGTASNIAEVLGEQGIDLLYDKNLNVGAGFTEQIMQRIAHAHVFLPVLTKRASARQWVQQEIGYAVALRVPVVPVAIQCDPGQLLHGIEAIRLEDATMDTLRSRLSRSRLEKCLQHAKQDKRMVALFECGETTEERAELIAKYANAVTELERYGEVRQLGGLSSFHIPRETIHHPVWTRRYGNVPAREHHKLVLREERLSLTKHSRRAGCKLIIDIDLKFSKYGGDARLARLESIRNFLRGEMNEANCEVALGKDRGENLLIVGDWFAARSIHGKEGEGYRQTMFTRHGPYSEEND